jgi:hypothetical protein
MIGENCWKQLKAAHDPVEGMASLTQYQIMKTRYLFLEFVAGNGREQLWPQCYVVNVIVENDLSQSPQRRECHLDGLTLLAHLFIEFPRGVGLHPDDDFVEHVDCLINRVAVTLPQKASQRC